MKGVSAQNIKAPVQDTAPAGADQDSFLLGMNDQTATYFVVVTDTGSSYHRLHEYMMALHQSASLEIDTMGRGYNKAKDLIALPEDDEDEMYAGEYFPRRFPSTNLSLEYLSLYREHAHPKTIALIAGIYGTAPEADSAASVLRKQRTGAFVLKSEIYIGCMH